MILSPWEAFAKGSFHGMITVDKLAGADRRVIWNIFIKKYALEEIQIP